MKKILVLSIMLFGFCYATQCDYDSVKPKITLDENSSIYARNPLCDCDKIVNKYETLGTNKCAVSFCSDSKKVFQIICTKQGSAEALYKLKKKYNVN